MIVGCRCLTVKMESDLCVDFEQISRASIDAKHKHKYCMEIAVTLCEIFGR